MYIVKMFEQMDNDEHWAYEYLFKSKEEAMKRYHEECRKQSEYMAEELRESGILDHPDEWLTEELIRVDSCSSAVAESVTLSNDFTSSYIMIDIRPIEFED